MRRIYFFFSITIISLLFVLFFLSSDITGAVVLQQSVGFVQEKIVVSSGAKAISVFSLTFGVMGVGMLTCSFFHRVKKKRCRELDQHMEKEMLYKGL